MRLAQRSRELSALYEASLAITAELSIDRVLQRIVDVSRDLVAARYAALTVLGKDGSLQYFVTAGSSADEAAGIGRMPQGLGLLGLLLRRKEPLRFADIAARPEAVGFPPGHPTMTSFLGAPLMHRGQVIGGLYLTDKLEAKEFTADDEALIEMLAAQAAVAVENARLFSLTDEALRQKVDELQAERDNLRAIVDQLPEGVAIVDESASRVLMLNRAALTLLRGGDLPPGESEDVSRLFRPTRANSTPMPLADTVPYRAVLKGEKVVGEPMYLERLDGSVVTTLANGAPLYDGAGKIIGGIVVFQDITALREIDRVKDELVSIISHELRNPLTAIRGRAQLMLRSARRSPEREADVAGLEAIDAQVGKLADMVRELLDVSQMRLGLMELHRQPTDLVALVRQSIEQFQAGDDRPAIEFEPVVDRLEGTWDAVRLEQVVFNLLENAAKYSSDGGHVKVSVTERDGGEIRARRPSRNRRDSRPAGGRWAVVAISDEGIGIPQEALKHLFDRFYRAANAKGRAETGLGLGLYICHEIVSQHGGSIWVKSVEGKGTTFFFDLPL